MISVDEIYKTCLSIANKANGTFTPAEFNRYAPLASNDLFNKYLGSVNQYDNKSVPRIAYAKTQAISENLHHLIVTDSPLTLTSGKAITPVDKEYIIGLSCESAPFVDRVEGSEFNIRKNSVVFTATDEYPIYRELATELEFLPADITGVKLTYLKQPVTPKWAYTITDGKPICDSSSSTDFDWQERDRMNLITRILSYLGIQLGDMSLTQYGEAKTQNAS